MTYLKPWSMINLIPIMSTNHKPALEGKHAKSKAIRDSIHHERALPLHTKLKYRSDIRKPFQGKSRADSLKEQLIHNESITDKIIIRNEQEHLIKGLNSKQPVAHEEQSDYNQHGYREDSSKVDLKYVHHGSLEDDTNDSEGETEELLNELAKIKKEKEEELEKNKKQDDTEFFKTSNPLVRVADVNTGADFKPKKNWRQTTSFRNRDQLVKPSEKSYTNDTLNSDFHKKFLDKYVK